MTTDHFDTITASAPVPNMLSCPYPHKNGDRSQTQLASSPHNKLAVSTCAAPSCLQPVCFCPACGATNRTLAKFCRNCRQPLSFEDALAQWHAELEIQQQTLTRGARLLTLSRLQGAVITALENAWGYLVFAAPGWGVGILSNTYLNPPHLLYRYALGDGDEIIDLPSIMPVGEGPAVLAVGRDAIHAITFLPRFEGKRIFRVPEPGWHIESALPMQTCVIVRLHHTKSKNHRWFVLESVREQVRELPIQARGALSAMVAVPEAGRFFYASEAEIVQYDLPDQKEHRFAAPTYGLNVNVAPRLHPRTGEFFWQGLDGFVYRYTFLSHKARFKSFGQKRYEPVHFFCNAYDDYLHVLTRDDLIVLDYPGGAELWNLSQQVNAKVQCASVPPRPFGNHMLFAFRSPSLGGPEERVGLFSLTRRQAPLLLHPAVATAPMPIAGVSNLIGVRRAQTREEKEKSALLLFQV